MKKLLSLFLALLILICTFSACAGNAAKPETPSSAASSDSTRPVVGISMSTQTQARQLKDVEYLTASLDALGYDVLVQYADMDPTKQVSQIENMINNGVCDVTAFLIAPEVIDKDNYQAALFDSGYYSEDQLK